eukprot:NODE_104_length_19294_cov_0.449179.p7 type:complete len:325 gc:universal NODE_104_length_19294_cov_0.449179:4337-3363(-)
MVVGIGYKTVLKLLNFSKQWMISISGEIVDLHDIKNSEFEQKKLFAEENLTNLKTTTFKLKIKCENSKLIDAVDLSGNITWKALNSKIRIRNQVCTNGMILLTADGFELENESATDEDIKRYISKKYNLKVTQRKLPQKVESSKILKNLAMDIDDKPIMQKCNSSGTNIKCFGTEEKTRKIGQIIDDIVYELKLKKEVSLVSTEVKNVEFLSSSSGISSGSIVTESGVNKPDANCVEENLDLFQNNLCAEEETSNNSDLNLNMDLHISSQSQGFANEKAASAPLGERFDSKKLQMGKRNDSLLFSDSSIIFVENSVYDDSFIGA